MFTNNPSYLITVSTDTKTDIITYFEINKKVCGDADALIPVINECITNTWNKHKTVNADSEFALKVNYEDKESNNFEIS